MINPERLTLNSDSPRGTARGQLCSLVSRQLITRWLAVSLLLIAAGLGSAHAQQPPPVLVSEPTSTRAVALESVTFVPEPFAPVSPYSWNADHRTRIMLFAMNLSLQPGENLSSLTADAEDAAHRHYNLLVEYVGPVPEQQWMSAVVLRLSDDLGDVGDVLVRVSHQGMGSNRVRVAIGHKGGGPADDPGAGPTPPPPYVITGQVTLSGTGLSGVTLNLSGSQTGTLITDASGVYQFTVSSAGGTYTITPSKSFYDFSPSSRSFNNFSNNQTNVNFIATRQAYTIAGRVLDDAGQGFDGVQVTVTNEAGTTISTSVTTNGGSYSFANLPAGFGYTVTPASNNIFTFTARSTNLLTGNLTFDFTGVRRSYTISGRAVDGAGNPISGATISLSGSQLATTTTNSGGNYTFANVNAGRNYTVAPSKTHYLFTPSSQVLNNLSGNQTADFQGALRSYAVTGRVTDSAGRGLVGVTVTLNGSQANTFLTGSDGSYSFSATALGNYTFTPSIEQDWHTFSPLNQTLNNLSSDQIVNFTAALAPIPNPSYVLEFDRSPKTVDYGYIWDPDVDLGHFFWEFWAMPGNNAGARYMLTDGYGGAHALLFGFVNIGQAEPGRYGLFGNIFDGVQVIYFYSDQGPAPGEWGHFAVGWDGQSIITYFNGVPVGKAAFTGPRRTPGYFGGGGRLLIGGSDHSNLDGRIAQVRGYEGSNPREDATGVDQALVESTFNPQNVFGVDGNILSYYFRSAPQAADLSRGLNGSAHPGLLRGTSNGVLYQCPGCPVPTFVIDPTAPNFATGAAPAPTPVGNPAAVPGGARIFDSFSRANSTYVFNGKGGLGATEGGAAGSKVWQTNQDSSQPQPFGILNGRAVLLANVTQLTWIATGSSSANLDTRVNRKAGSAGSGLDTGLSFRVLDDRSFFFAYTSAGNSESSPRTLTVGYYLAGQRINLVTGMNMPASWTTLRVLTKSSGEVVVYADATSVYSTNNSTLANAVGAGLYNNSSGLGLVNRWDNFTVFDVP